MSERNRLRETETQATAERRRKATQNRQIETERHKDRQTGKDRNTYLEMEQTTHPQNRGGVHID